MTVLYALSAAVESLDTSTNWTAVSLVVGLRKLRTQVRIPAGSANRCGWQTNEWSDALLPSAVLAMGQVPAMASGLAGAPSSRAFVSARTVESAGADLSSPPLGLAWPAEPPPPPPAT